jgi:hypothetical protein
VPRLKQPVSTPSAATDAGRLVRIGSNGKPVSTRSRAWVAVYDPVHDLTWSRTIGGRANHEEALRVASALDLLGHTDWLLPTRAQLLTLVDDTRVKPAIDTRAFPNCRSDWYWTRTPVASSPSACAWLVGFGNGGSAWYDQSLGGFVRAVRPGQ